MAKSPPTFTTSCAPDVSVDPAGAGDLCKTMTDMLAAAGWVPDDATPTTTFTIKVHALQPNSVRLSLLLSRADGHSHVINRTLSVSDTTVSPAIQARFLQGLIADIPPDF